MKTLYIDGADVLVETVKKILTKKGYDIEAVFCKGDVSARGLVVDIQNGRAVRISDYDLVMCGGLKGRWIEVHDAYQSLGKDPSMFVMCSVDSDNIEAARKKGVETLSKTSDTFIDDVINLVRSKQSKS